MRERLQSPWARGALALLQLVVVPIVTGGVVA
jgi:hypothetical protein